MEISKKTKERLNRYDYIKGKLYLNAWDKKRTIHKGRNKMVKLLQIKTIRCWFFLFILEKVYLKKKVPTEWIKRHTHSLLVKVRFSFKDIHHITVFKNKFLTYKTVPPEMMTTIFWYMPFQTFFSMIADMTVCAQT